MKTEIAHASKGEYLYNMTQQGWMHMNTPHRSNDSRLTGGWWMYKGNHTDALALLEVRMAQVKRDSDAYYAQCWV